MASIDRDDLQRALSRLLDGKKGADQRLLALLADVPVAQLVELGAHAAPVVRAVVARALPTRSEPEALELATRLAADAEMTVRAAVAAAAAEHTSWLPDAPLAALMADTRNYESRRDALRAAGSRPTLVAEFERLLADESWDIRQLAARALGGVADARVLRPLLERLAIESDEDAREECAKSLEARLAADGWPDDAPQPDVAPLIKAERRVRDMDTAVPTLAAWLTERAARLVDPDELARFGANLTAEAAAGTLPRAHGVQPALAAVRRVLETDGPRAVVLLGPSGAGKTAVVHELVHELAGEGWHVVRVSPSDIMAGTVYLGEWETKVRNLLQAVKAPRRALVYVPNLEELNSAGKASKSDMNVATMLAPFLQSGELALIGESTGEAFSSGLGRDPSLRGLFQRIEVQPATRAQTLELIQLVAAEQNVELDEAFAERLVELADVYLQGTEQPGRSLSLLRRVLDASGGEAPAPRAVLATLHEATGIPVDFLDDESPLDLEATRAFFGERVMGQPEAVDAVIDLVTLIKAGLTDRGKPYGVLFFVGPTGVGKTELARAVAELLFGDAGRLLRFDMSEFATYEAFERLIGKSGQPGQLTQAVRERPFSVVLLDEIEKAHANVFDLCLQIFDAGRLTDTEGRVARFQNTIVILTSNVGSAVRTDPRVGLTGAAPPPPDREATGRELLRVFRPEFLNRLDRIVHFEPLAAETAERIARRELVAVLERSGITRRRLVLDVDDGVIALLLRDGYSPAFGARPLKRVVEQHVLLPVARELAQGRVDPGSVLRLVRRGDRVRVTAVPGDDDGDAHEPPPPALADVVARLDTLRPRVDAVAARRSELVERSNAPDFWERPADARDTLDELQRLDALLAAARRLAKEVGVTQGNRDPERAAEFTRRHALELERVAFLLAADDLADAVLTLSAVPGGEELGGVEKLARMYRGFARRHGFEVVVLDDRQGGTPPEDTVTLALHGAGAHALLAGESGLHRLSWARTGEQRRRVQLVRVDALRLTDDTPPDDELEADVRPLRGATGRLVERPRWELHLRHTPSMASISAWWDGERDELLDACRPWLAARVAAGARVEGHGDELVRRYRLGPSPLVRDRRTGRATGHLDRVLRGEIDAFVVGEGAPSAR